MTPQDWQSSSQKSIAIYIDGTVAPDLGEHGQPMLDDDVLILVNGSPRPVTFTIPQVGKQCSWHTEVDSFDPPAETASRQPAGAMDATGAAGMASPGTPASPADPAPPIVTGDQLTVGQRSFILLLAPNPAPAP